MMKTLFENEFIRITSNVEEDIVEIIGKQICDDLYHMKQSLDTIKQCVKESSFKKMIFRLDDFDTVGNETILYDEFIPSLGSIGVKHIAVVTGKNRKTQVFFEELGHFLDPIKKQFHIQSKQFETKTAGIKWIEAV